MGKYVETCGSSSSTSSVIANGGIKEKQNIGYFKSLFYVEDEEGKTPAELKDLATLNSYVAAGKGIFLGDGKFEDTSTEATFFEDAELEIKIEQTAKIKSLKFTLNTCACTSAELEKLENKSGRLFIQTSTGLLVGRYNDGKGLGWKVSSISVDSTIPVSDTPVEYTTLDITFDDHKGDRKNPFRIEVDYLFSDVDEVYSAEGSASAVSTTGSALSATLNVTKECTNEKLTGLAVGNLKATDVDGNVLVIASYNDSNGAIEITTDKSKAYVSTDGIVSVNNLLYYMDNVTVSV